MSLIKNLLIFITLASFSFTATDGTIRGQILDAKGEPLPGVQVYIPDTGWGANTDLDGNYIILNIQVGTYDVTALMAGYAKTVTKDVSIMMDGTVWLNIVLEEKITQEETISSTEVPAINNSKKLATLDILHGCTNEDACNYDLDANSDDNSCLFCGDEDVCIYLENGSLNYSSSKNIGHFLFRHDGSIQTKESFTANPPVLDVILNDSLVAINKIAQLLGDNIPSGKGELLKFNDEFDSNITVSNS